jgi:hypothetical protein
MRKAGIRRAPTPARFIKLARWSPAKYDHDCRLAVGYPRQNLHPHPQINLRQKTISLAPQQLQSGQTVKITRKKPKR